MSSGSGYAYPRAIIAEHNRRRASFYGDLEGADFRDPAAEA